ncbi:GINS complex subunit [Rhizophlyctis rosea]|nr:GINS complex subunit [Rhizophlyctis rosea]
MLTSDSDAMLIDEGTDFLSSDTTQETYTNDDVQSLTKHWINERFAPELLPYQGVLVANLLEMVEAQTGNIETSRPDTPESAFMVVLYQQEMERIKYVIRSYLRTRLVKIQKHTLHLLRDEEYRSRMSPEELDFAERFNDLMDRHYYKSCLETLPTWLHRLDENINGVDMVSKPDLEDAVICRVKEDIGEFQLDDGGDTIVMRRGNIYLLRYKTIRALLEEDKVELI